MSKTLFGVTIFLAFLQPTAGLTTEVPDDSSRIEVQQVLAVEDEYIAAEVSRDEATLRRLVDNRFVLNSSNGRISDKEALISGVLRMNMVGQTISERTALVEGDIAIIFGTAELRFGGAGQEDTTSVLRYTSTYVNRKGQWRMLALQMTTHTSTGSHGSGKTPTDTATLKAFASKYTAAWCSQDAASVASFFSENGSLTINDGVPSTGRTAITAAAQSFMTAFPDMVVTMDDLSLDDGYVTYHWTLTGTNTGPAGSGKAVRISGYEEWTIGADGLIEKSLGHFDESEYQRQLQEGAALGP
jgi:ketosteroid isomerase-like protein